jgi:hypothetical protein
MKDYITFILLLIPQWVKVTIVLTIMLTSIGLIYVNYGLNPFLLIGLTILLIFCGWVIWFIFDSLGLFNSDYNEIE